MIQMTNDVLKCSFKMYERSITWMAWQSDKIAWKSFPGQNINILNVFPPL